MSWIDKAKIGDKVRYLGGDPFYYSGTLTKYREYFVRDIDGDGDLIIKADNNFDWCVGPGANNLTAFELVESESTKTTEDLIASLAQTVTQLERELNELKYKYEIDREMFIDDIAMIDERTQPAETNLVRKTVTYDYER